MLTETYYAEIDVSHWIFSSAPEEHQIESLPINQIKIPPMLETEVHLMKFVTDLSENEMVDCGQEKFHYQIDSMLSCGLMMDTNEFNSFSYHVSKQICILRQCSSNSYGIKTSPYGFLSFVGDNLLYI
eukprot:Awhi_evm2s8603